MASSRLQARFGRRRSVRDRIASNGLYRSAQSNACQSGIRDRLRQIVGKPGSFWAELVTPQVTTGDLITIEDVPGLGVVRQMGRDERLLPRSDKVGYRAPVRKVGAPIEDECRQPMIQAVDAIAGDH